MSEVAGTFNKLLKDQSIQLSARQIEQLLWLMDELLRWNQRRNLTAITKPLDVIEKHLIDSLSLVPYLPESGRLLDLGSGAGFPGLPLKIACPEFDVVSVDAVAKKIQFQRHVARTLGLSGFTAVHGRVEACQQHAAFREGFDRVTARAVTQLGSLVALAGDYVRPDGALVAMKGPEGPQEWQECRGELEEEGWSLQLETLFLPLSGAERCLLILTRKSTS